MDTRLSFVFVFTCVFSQVFCQWRQYDDKVYYYSHHHQDARTYSDAVDACNTEHGGALLVSINSEEENMFLAGNVDSSAVWTSLICRTDDRCNITNLRWADGSRVTYKYSINLLWMVGQSALFIDRNGAWGSNSYTHRRYYICERADPCTSSPCVNGGTCLMNTATGNWTCDCPDSTGGENCACEDNICENNRPCVVVASEATCDCSEAFNGSRCELDNDECLDSNFCNGGGCANFYGGFSCICPPNREGERCADDVNECQATPSICEHGGTCINEPEFSYICHCSSGYCGRNCEAGIDECVPQDAVIAMITIVCIMTVTVVIAVSFGVIYVHKLKKRIDTINRRQNYAAPEANHAAI